MVETTWIPLAYNNVESDDVEVDSGNCGCTSGGEDCSIGGLRMEVEVESAVDGGSGSSGVVLLGTGIEAADDSCWPTRLK